MNTYFLLSVYQIGLIIYITPFPAPRSGTTATSAESSHAGSAMEQRRHISECFRVLPALWQEWVYVGYIFVVAFILQGMAVTGTRGY